MTYRHPGVALIGHPLGRQPHEFLSCSQALTIITCVMSFLAIVLVALILKKIWFKPAGMAVCTILWTILTLGVAIAAWACFLVYGEVISLSVSLPAVLLRN